MFALLLDSNASNEVSSKLYKLKEKLYQNNVHFSMVVNFLKLKKSNMILIKTYNFFSTILILLGKKVR